MLNMFASNEQRVSKASNKIPRALHYEKTAYETLFCNATKHVFLKNHSWFEAQKIINSAG